MKGKVIAVWGMLLGMAGTMLADAPDMRVKNRLDAREFKYEITKAGNFKAIIECDNERTQLVYINSATERLGNMEIREVWSLGYKGTLTNSIMRRMLRSGEEFKLGAWGCNEDEDRAYFTAKIPANLPAADLVKVIFAVGKAADKLEAESLGNDDL